MNFHSARFNPQSISDISRHLSAAYPNEGCGILIGSIDASGVAVITRAAVTRNAETLRGADRFIIDPRDMLAVEKELSQSKNNQRVIGFLHSHPDAPPTPSKTDLEMALGAYDVAREHYLHLIGSVLNGELTSIKCWKLDEGARRFIEVRHAEA